MTQSLVFFLPTLEKPRSHVSLILPQMTFPSNSCILVSDARIPLLVKSQFNNLILFSLFSSARFFDSPHHVSRCRPSSLDALVPAHDIRSYVANAASSSLLFTYSMSTDYSFTQSQLLRSSLFFLFWRSIRLSAHLLTAITIDDKYDVFPCFFFLMDCQ